MYATPCKCARDEVVSSLVTSRSSMKLELVQQHNKPIVHIYVKAPKLVYSIPELQPFLYLFTTVQNVGLVDNGNKSFHL